MSVCYLNNQQVLAVIIFRHRARAHKAFDTRNNEKRFTKWASKSVPEKFSIQYLIQRTPLYIFLLDFTHSQNIKYRFLIILRSYCRDRFSTYILSCSLWKIVPTFSFLLRMVHPCNTRCRFEYCCKYDWPTRLKLFDLVSLKSLHSH